MAVFLILFMIYMTGVISAWFMCYFHSYKYYDAFIETLYRRTPDRIAWIGESSADDAFYLCWFSWFYVRIRNRVDS